MPRNDTAQRKSMERLAGDTEDASHHLKISLMALSALTPYAGNPRRNDAGVPKVAESIRRFGFRQPIVVDRNLVIVAGHTRFLAAKKLRLKEVPVHVAADLSADQARAYRLADNRTAQEALWDEDKLIEELQTLDREIVNATAFDQDELDRLLAHAEASLDEEPPESVQKNLERMEEVRAIRKTAREAVSSRDDTERYLVVVFPDRAAREAAVRRLGLPDDERYVDAAVVDLRRRVGRAAEPVKASRPTKAASPRRSGATG